MACWESGRGVTGGLPAAWRRAARAKDALRRGNRLRETPGRIVCVLLAPLDAAAAAGMIRAMSDSGLASDLPEPPYYAVIFSSLRTAGENGYGAMAERMVALAGDQPGFLGIESVRDANGVGITVSYWRDEASIAAWKKHAEPLVAQARGRREWYEAFELRVAKVERAYGKRPSRGGGR